MRVALAAFSLVLLAGSGAGAQRSTFIGAGITLNAPSGDLGDWHHTGFGIDAAAEHEVSLSWSFTGQFGFNRFSGKEIRGIPGAAPDLDAWNLAAGIRAYLGNGRTYIGAAFARYSYSAGERHVSNDGLGSDYGIVPAIGYRAGTFDVSANYKLGGEVQWLQLRGVIYFVRL